MRRPYAILLLAGLVAGCGASPRSGASPVTLAGLLHAPKGPTPASAAGLLLTQPAAFTPPAPPVKLPCDAASLTYLIGRPRTEIPVPADLSRRRVACSTCVAPSDHQPTRTDIIFDAATGRVTAVTCG